MFHETRRCPSGGERPLAWVVYFGPVIWWEVVSTDLIEQAGVDLCRIRRQCVGGHTDRHLGPHFGIPGLEGPGKCRGDLQSSAS